MTGSGRKAILAPRRILVAILICASFVFCPASSCGATIGLYTNESGTTCEVQAPPLGGNLDIHVIVKFTPGSTAAQFKFAFSGSTPYVIANWREAPGFLSIGSPESGLGVAFPGCLVGDFIVGTLSLQRVAEPTGECCSLRVVAHPQSLIGAVELYDCASMPTAIPDHCLWIVGEDRACALAPPPSDPAPADGSADVPLDVILNASIHDPDFCCPLLFGEWTTLYFGTSSNPPIVHELLPFDPDLAPATTYYWQVVYHNTQAPSVASPVWSFTTASTTPATMSTWGAIKALYR